MLHKQETNHSLLILSAAEKRVKPCGLRVVGQFVKLTHYRIATEARYFDRVSSIFYTV